MLIQDLVAAVESLAPLDFAQPWDNAGLVLGDAGATLAGPVLLAIDLTEPVLDEAIEHKAGAVIAYHPPIWDALKRITASTPRERVLLRAARAGLAVYSPHTALDAAPGGMTDWLCEGLSGSTQPGKIAGDCRALLPHAALPATAQCKIVTFVPAASADEVRHALASSGAGIIGRYEVCSFAVSGTGTFLAGEGANPSVGVPGRLEHAPEQRLEMVCSRAALPLALEALRRFHPYEEPAIDVYDLVPQPRRSAGAGRRLVLDRPAPPAAIAKRLKEFLGVPVVRLAPAAGRDPAAPVEVIGVCPGAGAELAPVARDDRCALFVTGEMKHHEVLAATHAGLGVLLAGHTNTERGYLGRFAEALARAAPGARFLVSRADRDPLEPL